MLQVSDMDTSEEMGSDLFGCISKSFVVRGKTFVALGQADELIPVLNPRVKLMGWELVKSAVISSVEADPRPNRAPFRPGSQGWKAFLSIMGVS